ncbi:cellulose biosynthesis protein BcsC [Pseudomonas sp. 5P_3.1_Bac2]|uniref:cellulose biosynthesis protein BcsC n=1 Tax=Pseudomonas sp. 5P_3.1_Bac2 TaxID=2971617 RepID=UPI0021C724F8|nr:cellulose biosynthesis protein BcsC [Pseudomonas sp. 5P_3.1_Bac2]MCU1717240.1 cellulose synthase subunit BcsC-related outer membrane protein [Pseudomonas sp. 5P_3.1_Bac2]
MASEAAQALVKQAQFWYEKGNNERSREAWARLQQLEPGNVQAIYWQGVLAARGAELDKAAEYLALLKQNPAAQSQALQLDQEIYLQQSGRPEQLEQARVLAESGELDSAVAAYRKLLGTRTAQGDLAFEFYNYLGYTDEGWNEAKEGLARVHKQFPQRSDIALAQAKLLTRNQATRVEGLKQLSVLADHPQVGTEALETWRDVLTWMGPPRADAMPLFHSYLKRVPDDQEIRKQLNAAKAQPVAAKPVVSPLAGAFKALEGGQVSKAEQQFEQRLNKYPNDADALGGLGLIRQKQNRLEDAELLLGRAIKQKGGQHWRKNYNEVRYWTLLRQANDNREAGQLSEARKQVEQALLLKPAGTDALVAKADLQSAEGRYGAAESGYRAALKQAPGSLSAKRGLIGVLSQQGKHAEAQRLVDSLPNSARETVGDLSRIRGEQAFQRARLAQQRGDPAGQRAALEEALQHDPEHIWARYDLARVYVALGARDEARSLMEGLLQAKPNDADALYAAALSAVELGDWPRAKELLARLPLEGRDAQLNRLVSEVDFQQRMQEINGLNKAGRYQEARVFLSRVAPLAAGHPQREAMMASAYAAAKDPQRALTMLREQLARSPRFDAGLTLSYANVLLQTEHDAEVAAILRDLQSRPLNTSERAQYDDVLFLYRVRQAEQLVERDQLAEAYETLSPALLQRPQDPTAMAVLARMYAHDGDKQKALELYKSLAQRHTDNPLLLIGAADMAAQQGYDSQADAWLEQALKVAPQDPDVLSGAARVYRQQGRSAKAKELLQKVVAQEQRQQQVAYAASSPSSAPSNPFAKKTGSGSASAPLPAASIPEPVSSLSAAPQTAIPSFAKTPAAPGLAPGSTNNPFANGAAEGSPDPRAGMSDNQRLLDDLIQERSAYVVQGLQVRTNDSEKGLSKLTDVQAPLEINFPAGDSRLAVRVTPVHLDAGSVGSDAKQRFGGGVLSVGDELSGYLAGGPSTAQAYAKANELLASSPGKQRDSGVGLAVAWEHEPTGLKADIGVSPLGFLYSTAVGGVSKEGDFRGHPNLRYSVSASRRAVTDSLTSFAGAHDARIDEEWGGVTANGVRGQLGYDNSRFGVYGYASAHALRGHNVKDNTRAELGSGVYWYLLNAEEHLLTAGLSLTAIGYENNQSSFNYGSGGYFSPQKFFSLAVPVQWAQRGDRWTYKVNGAVGVQHFSQESTPYLINDSDAQRALENLSAQAAGSGLYLPTRYDGSSKTGIGYSLAAAGEYQLGKHFFLGGHLGVDNAQDYQQWNGGLYLRYMVESMTSPLELPVSPYQSPYVK